MNSNRVAGMSDLSFRSFRPPAKHRQLRIAGGLVKPLKLERAITVVNGTKDPVLSDCL
jgi:hypothetical protein